MSQWLISQDKYLTPDETKQLRKTCRDAALLAKSRGVQAPVRDALIIELALGTGLRVSELSKLKIEDLYLKKGQNSLFVKNGKGGKDRVVQFSACEKNPTEPKSVKFTDPHFEGMIRLKLGIPTDEIMPEDMLTITNFLAISQNISDLTGLQYCKNLDTLILDVNKITDLSPLSGLTNLTILALGTNNISDISPLAGLTNLVVLNLSFNEITDIGALAGLTKLEELGLGTNQIADLSPLSGITRLERLSLPYNQVVDLSALALMTNLHFLWLTNNQVVDLSPIVGLTKLNTLYLNINQIVDLEPLSSMT
ncbi:leucine-rich repeat domain-containing protein [Candidatus Neomarinimicrobiota bacterium]